MHLITNETKQVQKKNKKINKKKSRKHKHCNLLKEYLNKGIFTINNYTNNLVNLDIYETLVNNFNFKLGQIITDKDNLSDNIIPNSILPKTSIYYTPSQLIKVYGLDKPSLPTQRGFGIKVAVIIAYHYANLQKDFNSYCTYYRLPAQTLVIKSYTSVTKSGWAEECCLDIQTIHTIAPYAQIMVVEAASAKSPDLLTAIKYAVANGANIISMSWGGNENSSFINLYDTYFASVSNVCFVASSGDVTNIVNYPSTSPNVISVGGTNITRNLDGTRNTETPWYNNSNSGTGNGYSKYINKPKYQNNITNITENKRCTPDISLIADPNSGFAINYAGKYYIFGGTSLAAPIMSGILAIGNQIRKNNKKPLLSSVATSPVNVQTYMYQTIYANNPNKTEYANIVPYTANMYDVSVGYNGIFSAGLGYDIASGLGSLNPNIFCNSLNNI